MESRVCVVLAVAWLLVPALAVSSQANPPRVLGGLDLQGYCQNQRYDGVVLEGGAIIGHNVFNNWRCQTAGNTHPFSFEQACRWQYGLQAVQARPTDRDDAFGWRCYSVATH